MTLIDDLLEKTCKNMIKTILFCLDNATKGTIYRIGSMPKLQAVRVTSGIRVNGTDEIQWGLPSASDYNYPGKLWEQYRDRPDHVLEAMGWCVEKQKSWTAENPFEDVRSVGKQMRGEIEDFYHMEPVLVRKSDLYGNCPDYIDYPLDWRGNPIWQDSEYVVAAVIKIHFLPYTIHRDDRSTKIIQELSRSLGTELLSLHLRETLSRAQKDFARQRLHSCKILAHELRNTLIKFGFIFSAINAEIGVLREEWESQLARVFPEMSWKGLVLERLSDLIRLRISSLNGGGELVSLCKALLSEQEELRNLTLLPSQAEQWLNNRIRPKWRRLLEKSRTWDGDREEINQLLDRLQESLRLGMDRDLIEKVTHLPQDLCEAWVRVAYTYFTADKLFMLDEIIQLLDHPALPIRHKQQIKKVVTSLKVLVEVVPEVEERANNIILSLRYGTFNQMSSSQELEIYSCQMATDLLSEESLQYLD
jgi:hypothetical protein